MCRAVSSISSERNAHRVRSNYLRRLGISANDSLGPTFCGNLDQGKSSLRLAPTVVVPLKADYGEKDNGMIQDKRATDVCKRRRCVSFDKSVTVRQIPQRTEYSKRVRSFLWSGREEIEENAYRNAVEFAAENWDWRQAANEEDMIRNEDGELVHPVHFRRRCNLHRQFFMVMSAQRAQSSF